MTITDSLIRIKNAKDNLRQSLVNKGISIPNDALLDEYSSIIDETELYGPIYKNFYDMRTNNGTNMDALFARTTGELDLRQLDVSQIISMQYMFDNSTANVNIDGWDTSKLENMSYMFDYFTGSVDMSKLDTNSVTNVSNMFYYANTDNVILTGLSFPSTTSLKSMFNNAKGTVLDLSSWDINNITNMDSMFNDAEHKKIDLTGWKTTNVKYMSSMFYKYASLLEELIIPDWDMTNTTSYSNFYYVGNSSNKNTLRLIDLSRSNDVTITKVASCLPTRTNTTYGDIIVPSNTSQEVYDSLIAKYWRPVGADLSPAPTSVEIIAELDDIRPGKSTKVYIGAWEPWYADTTKLEIVSPDESIATMEGDTITSTGVIGDILLEVRVRDTQEVVGTKIIPVSEEDLSPNIIKFRASSVGTASYQTNLTVNGTEIRGNNTALVYDKYSDLYSYDVGAPITNLKFESSYCKLTEIVKLNTSSMTTMEKMLYSQKTLITLELSEWTTSNVKDMSSMFCYCNNLESLDIRNFDMTNATTQKDMFSSCTSLHTLRLDNCNRDTINKIITSSNFPTNAIDGVTRTIYCKEEEAWDLTPPTNWVFEYIKEELPEPEEPCPNCGERDCDGSCYDKGEGGEIALYNFGQFRENSELTEVSVMVVSEHDNLEEMFVNCHSLTTIIGIDEWDTSNVMRMTDMFKGCESLESLDLSSFNTESVENMERMFKDCHNLRELNLSSFNTERVDNMNEMFNCCCEGLESLDLSNFNTENVRDMTRMFADCRRLRELNIGFNTTNVEEMREMFQGCESLESLDLSSFNTENVRNMERMFANCNKLRYLNLSNFNTDNTENINEMFGGCHDLIELRLDNCGRDTINWITYSGNLPEGHVFDFDLGEPTTRKIYCKESETETWMHLPNGWEFSYVDGEPEDE